MMIECHFGHRLGFRLPQVFVALSAAGVCAHRTPPGRTREGVAHTAVLIGEVGSTGGAPAIPTLALGACSRSIKMKGAQPMNAYKEVVAQAPTNDFHQTRQFRIGHDKLLEVILDRNLHYIRHVVLTA